METTHTDDVRSNDQEAEVWQLVDLDERQLPQLLTYLKGKAADLKSLFT